MKKVVTTLVFISYTLLCFAQESGLFKNTHKEDLIFLSQTKTVRNKDYPDSLKEKIIEFKNSLNKASAENILRTSLMLEDKTSIFFVGKSYINNGLGMNQIRTGTIRTTTNNGVNISTTTTSTSYSTAPILIPYSDIVNVYIRKFKNTFTVEFYTKIDRSVPASKRPYFGQNFFYFKIKPEADEISLIASLLYLCTNIKIKD